MPCKDCGIEESWMGIYHGAYCTSCNVKRGYCQNMRRHGSANGRIVDSRIISLDYCEDCLHNALDTRWYGHKDWSKDEYAFNYYR